MTKWQLHESSPQVFGNLEECGCEESPALQISHGRPPPQTKEEKRTYRIKALRRAYGAFNVNETSRLRPVEKFKDIFVSVCAQAEIPVEAQRTEDVRAVDVEGIQKIWLQALQKVIIPDVPHAESAFGWRCPIYK